MNAISSWSIRNPVPTIVLFLSLTIAGLYGFMQLRTNNMPDIDLPTVTVTVTQAGAAPSEMEVQVAQVIENAVASLDGVDDVSTSLSEGSSVTTVEFTLDTDPETATNDVRNAVSGVQASLPAAAQAPVVAKVNATGNSVLTYVVEAPTMSPDALSWYIDNDVAKAMLGVGGVSKITRSGGVDRVIRVELDPDRLAALGISAGDVSQTLAAINVNQPGGRTTIGSQEQSVRTLGSVTTVEALADTRVAFSKAGDVKLSDLGKVVDSWEKPRQAAYLDGREVVAFNIYRSVGSSEIDVVKAARAAIAEMGSKTTAATFTEVTSSSGFVRESYDAAFEALWLGALLAIGVVWLFLRDIRATLVSAVAMPLSLIPTFAVMAAFDISLNNITLLALSLVVGILVDDAIVEIENIVRHMRQTGVSAYQAAIEAADEIGLAVVATTATIVAVFLPVAFMPGIPGKFFFSFAVAVCVSVLFSLLVARMLTPLMGAYLVRAGGHSEEDTPAWVPTYLWLLRKALDHRWITLLAGIAFFAGSMALAAQLPTEFMAATDRGRSMISVELQPGSTIEQTTAVVKDITKRLEGEPAVDSVFATIGTAAESGGGPNRGSTSAEVRSANVTVNLKPRDERMVSQQEFEADASPKLNDIPGARIQFGADGFSGAKVSITLVGDNGDALQQTSDALIDQMKSVPGLSNPTSTAATTKPELIVRPDSARAAELGITPTEIAQTVKIATVGDTDTSLPKFNLGDRQVSIVVTLPDGAIDDPAKLAILPLTGSKGTVPLAAIADISFSAGPNSITRVDRSRSATIEADLSRITLGEATTAIRDLPAMQNLPAGVHELARGDAARMQELFSGFAMAIAAGIVLMYLTLVLLFRGFVQPVTILVALPLSVGGALGFMLITGKALGLSPLIGILMLMGIAAKNSILLVEYALVAQKERGMSRFEALLDAARKRARPIVMTSIAMGAGMLPIALGIGADAETRAPMAIAVIGGLISSTLLSLVYVPVVYTFMDDIQHFLGRHLSRLLVERSDADSQAATAISGKDPGHAHPV
ncbi:efflux RND transporter permease subunit [Mesorhizobium sp. YC-39]|uniref:efflux RND transporter permease subunit n=1 Tax=unclassified Mesorhizobium TaxID=325217 RepID=UPI0021E7844E|nr:MULTISPECIES: efflux RND transporter permease subunit [unclassified Mesorhizobium]MCV3208125.1 efflux RND transporter permease subunit [Mesorhizobium sp. YC-2]MCV3229852.1 efflux RND transporter permease subunit [Mesorhizobium sp. YC-39]